MVPPFADPFETCLWRLANGRTLTLGNRGVLMAIVNVTPDSFSDGGAYLSVDKALRHAEACLSEGALILDVGGESTRPGADPVTATEEQDRVLPVIARLASETDALISIDTYRAETARLALAAGTHIVNDVHGLQREPEIASVIAEAGAGVCIMHTGRGRQKHADVIADQRLFFERSLEIAARAGISQERIVLDPGFGFAKDADENWALLARLSELHALGHRLLIGTSRKRFLGAVTGHETASARDVATAATTTAARLAGGAIFRVHDVAINRDALAVADAILSARGRTFHTTSDTAKSGGTSRASGDGEETLR